MVGDVTNIALDPIFMFVFRLGVSGAAIAHVISQYVLMFYLISNHSTNCIGLTLDGSDGLFLQHLLDNHLSLLLLLILFTYYY